MTNIVVFSLWFWELDRCGPTERMLKSPIPPSFIFPEEATTDRGPHLGEDHDDARVGVSLSIAILVVARAIIILPS